MDANRGPGTRREYEATPGRGGWRIIYVTPTDERASKTSVDGVRLSPTRHIISLYIHHTMSDAR